MSKITIKDFHSESVSKIVSSRGPTAKVLPASAEMSADVDTMPVDDNPYPVDALGPLTDYAKAIQQETQAPMGIAGQSVLAAASLVTQPYADVIGLDGRPHPVSLYCLTIAASGERKSTVDRIACQPIMDVQHARQKAFMAEKTALHAKGEKDEADGQCDPIQVLNDMTIEGLYRHLETSNPSIALLADEGGVVLGGYGMSKDQRLQTISAFSNLWDGKSVTRVREGKGTKSFFGRRTSMHLMVQPSVALALTADKQARDQGFLARVLMVNPTSTIGYRKLHTADSTSRLAILAGHQRMNEILEQSPLVDTDDNKCLTPRRLELSGEAQTVLSEYANHIEVSQRAGEPLADFTGFASKSAEQAVRLAAVMALWENLDAKEVSAEHMKSGIQLAAFYLHEAVRILEASDESSEVNEADELYVWMRDRWPNVAKDGRQDKSYVLPSEITQFGPGRFRDKSGIVERVVQVLIDHDQLEAHKNVSVDGSNRKLAYKIM